MSIDTLAAKFTFDTLSFNQKNIASVLSLLFENDATIPFVARYRKEATGGMDEVDIAKVKETYEGRIEFKKRQSFILETIKKQEALTPEIEKSILQAETINQLEDIYAPYKSKRKTKGMKAIEAGLAPLADFIKSSADSIEEIAKKHAKEFINKQKKVENFQQALEGACDIIMEEYARNLEVKQTLREAYWKSGTLKAVKAKDADKVKDYEKFKDYFEYEQSLDALKDAKNSHRFLAVRRAVSLKILKASVEFDEEEALKTMNGIIGINRSLGCSQILTLCLQKAYKNSISNSLDLEMKSELKKLADESAIAIFGVNLKNLLLQPYLGAKAVMGIDPGVRTGCKIVVIDHTGALLIDGVIYPHPPKNASFESKRILEALIEKYELKHISVGNGTFGRETLSFLNSEVSPVKNGKVHATLINEDGASIYSASEIARKEFPDKDPTVRGAVSIARRFQDPLAELVKIDPKSIGVGQYQHDVNPAKLKDSLSGVVENCVNYVGVDLNTASAPLLSFIAGIGPSVAKNIVSFRQKNGPFKSRKELLKVSRFSEKVFEQAAGFLRIYGGENPLDSTFIHPERYQTLQDWCEKKSILLNDMVGKSDHVTALEKDDSLKNEIGAFTFDDMIKSLKAPSQDPRTEFKSFEYSKDLGSMGDLKVGSFYPGLVTNITQFGAFVDLGLKENGLIHISQMSDTFVDDPLKVLKVGQEVKAKVIEVDMDRKRIALSLKSDGKKEFRENYSSSKKSKALPKQDIRNNAFAGLKNLKLK